ncbi:suppressor for copper-sensitivity D, putative [Thioalkalivibrio nitratireducens DSM 14787]|uniref:Suppressor for copper-sensitivity D, putative n=1 Tax=Thioalkalivibrio nitratireducens (strain DSM 14787 / UNIQEM 213 / ALEN2) TaxID=1255043 RepID=L0DRN0_THIND|nr:protein disulfide oxidoreductase [Thioalkalivibrio nitratireducens]AGA32244.1 suppressor for copper-sensitivity D, putative [Thioalkalivibrio nitratireducens DSM 14787]
MNTAVKKRRPVWRWVLEIAIVIGLVLLVRAWIARDLAQGPAPAFEAQLLDGTPVSLAHFADEPMLLHFWATWCPICRLEEGEILRLSRSHPVLTVAMQSGTEAEVEAHLTERESELAVVNDPAGQLARTYGVRAVPSTFIIDRNGEIVFRKQGYAPPLELRFRLWLARWL